MIADITKVQEAIIQALREINDACLQMRGEGVTCLLPEFVDFEVRMVTGTDINAVTRTATDSEADGTVTTLREQLASDTERVESSGEQIRTERSPTQGQETTTITHPSVQTAGSGADNSEENVEYRYED